MTIARKTQRQTMRHIVDHRHVTFTCKSLSDDMASTKKLSCYYPAFKLKVVDFADENGNRTAEREIAISEKHV